MHNLFVKSTQQIWAPAVPNLKTALIEQSPIDKNSPNVVTMFMEVFILSNNSEN
jgi:hypothetical protein